VGHEELLAHCRTLIAGYKCPRSIEFRQTPMPLSGVGKVRKVDLRQAWLQARSGEQHV
jgi:long-chain acyl-CoA synthetase